MMEMSSPLLLPLSPPFLIPGILWLFCTVAKQLIWSGSIILLGSLNWKFFKLRNSAVYFIPTSHPWTYVFYM